MIHFAYIDSINKDELFYGWLLRIAIHNGYKNDIDAVSCFLEDFFCEGEKKYKHKKENADFPFGLENIINQLHPQIELDVYDIVINHTTFPVLCRAYEYGRQALYAQMMLREKSHVVNRTTKRQSTIDLVKYCPVCAREDFYNNKEPYIRTWHNFPGVKVCYRHKVKLLPISLSKIDINASEEIENNPALINYAKTMFRFYCDPILTSLSESKEYIKKEINKDPELKSELFDEIIQSGYPAIKSENDIKKTLKQKKIVQEILFSLLSFFETKKEIIEISRRNNIYDSPCIQRYKIKDQNNLIVKIEDEDGSFWIHPYAIVLGCENPEKEKNKTADEIISHQINVIGCGEYQPTTLLKGYDSINEIKHIKCGKIVKARAVDFVWNGRRCACSYSIGMDELQDQIERLSKEYKIVDYENTRSQIVTIEHCREAGGCGHRFKIKYNNFTSKIFCRNCGKGQLNVKERVEKALGSEYKVINCGNWKTNTIVLHTVCGTTTEGYPMNYINGKRCKLCTYGIKGHGVRGAGELYREIYNWCLVHSVWILKRVELLKKYNVEEQLIYLCKNKYIRRIAIGVYTTREQISVEEYIHDMFFEDHMGCVCGMYDAESLLYSLGIIEEKPEHIYVVTNNTVSKTSHSCGYQNMIIRVKAPYIRITSLNYEAIKVLNIIHYLSKHYRYFKEIKEYLIKNEVNMKMLKEYEGAYPVKTKKMILKISEEMKDELSIL